jgi:hypothetical protein
MTISYADMDAVLPEGLPPWEPRTADESARLKTLQEAFGEEHPQLRAFAWQTYTLRELHGARERLAEALLGLPWPHPLVRFSVGFIALDRRLAADVDLRRQSRERGYVFGVSLYDLSARERETPLHIPLLPDDPRIPVIRQPATEELHAPPHAVGASTACWAVERHGAGRLGVLMAKHSLRGLPTTARIPFQSGTPGLILAVAPSSVDAALVSAPFTPAAGLTALAVEPLPVIGQDVAMSGAQTPAFGAQIERLHIFPDDPDEYDPQRLYFNLAALTGDSGAVVTMKATGAAVAIYTGSKTTQGTTLGMSQYLVQAIEQLQVDPREEAPVFATAAPATEDASAAEIGVHMSENLVRIGDFEVDRR